VIRRAAEIYLSEYADHQIALDCLNDPGDPGLTTEQMWGELSRGKPEPLG